MLHFCRHLCQGKEAPFATVPAIEITNLRCEVACVFSTFKHMPEPCPVINVPIPPDTPIEALTPTPAPQTRPSSPPTPTPPTSPRLKLADFPIDSKLIAYSNHIKSQKPLPRITVNNDRTQQLSLAGIEVGMWHMFKHPCNGLYYPGRIRAVDRDQVTFEWEIVSETIHSTHTMVPGLVRVESVDKYLNNPCTGLYISQVISNCLYCSN